MRITVLGKSPSWSDAGGACSGYLVEEGVTALLLDCGNGVFGKLREHRPYAEIDAVVISHLHADHFLDLVPFSYALTYGPGAGGARPALHLPPDGRAGLRRVVGTWGPEELVEGAFTVREYHADETLQIGPLRVRFTRVPHFMVTHAVEVSTGAGARFTFGADTGPSDDLVTFAAATDLLMLEATVAEPEPDPEPRGHLTPAEAGEHAARAGARRLVVTHLTDETDPAWALGEVRRAYDGPAELAAQGAVYEL
ncbi:MAG TPA: MBL fold metallo-hydrolase [Solirubrobacteraceae bacterium]|nr:MBL fold metallo-hydrolase [Solirubrobacteraceae bacterium]